MYILWTGSDLSVKNNTTGNRINRNETYNLIELHTTQKSNQVKKYIIGTEIFRKWKITLD